MTLLDDVREQWDLLCAEVDASDDDLFVWEQVLEVTDTDVARRGVEQARRRCEKSRSEVAHFLDALDGERDPLRVN